MESTKQRKKINWQINYQGNNLYLLVNFISFFMFLTQNCGQDFDGIFSESKEQKHDINLLLQEHNFSRAQDCSHRTSNIQFKGGAIVWNAAAYSVATNGFKRGTGILTSPRVATLVKDHELIMAA